MNSSSDGERTPAVTERDAYGRRRSSRSIATGPGSRGGTDPGYWSTYRKANPEYRRAELRRRRLVREKTSVHPIPVSIAAREVLREEVARVGLRATARAVGLDHSLVARWLSWTRLDVLATVVDAVVATYTMNRILATRARLRREERARRREDVLRDTSSAV